MDCTTATAHSPINNLPQLRSIKTQTAEFHWQIDWNAEAYFVLICHLVPGSVPNITGSLINVHNLNSDHTDMKSAYRPKKTSFALFFKVVRKGTLTDMRKVALRSLETQLVRTHTPRCWLYLVHLNLLLRDWHQAWSRFRRKKCRVLAVN